MTDVKLPDGTIARFPDGTPPDVMKAAIQKRFPPKSASAPQQQPAMPTADQGQWERNTILPREVNTATGESRWAVPGMLQAPIDAFNLPGDVLTGKVDPMSNEGIARAAGAAAVLANPAGPLYKQPAALPIARTVGDKLVETAASAGAKALPRLPVANGIGTPLTVAGAKLSAKTAFKTAEDTGAVVGQQAMGALNSKMKEFAAKEGLVLPSGQMVDVFPKVRGAYKALDEFTAAPMSIKSAMVLQKHLRTVAKSTDPEEARLGSMMMDQFDEFMANLKPEAFAAGNGKKAVKEWMTAKTEWARFKRGETVLNAITAAQGKAHKFSGSGFENALRTEFDKIASNPRKIRYFSEEEKAFIEAVRQGKPLANALRGLGKAAPTGIVSTVLSGLAGYGIGGPWGALAMLGVGGVSRKLATDQTKKSAEEALQFVLGARPAAKAAPMSRLPQPVPGWNSPMWNGVAREIGAQPGGPVDATGLSRDDLIRRLGPTIGA